jgi:uncharacterized membrane-anchored protein YhcB (DUF1043 family)
VGNRFSERNQTALGVVMDILIFMWILLTIGIVVGISLGWWITRSILRTLINDIDWILANEAYNDFKKLMEISRQIERY